MDDEMDDEMESGGAGRVQEIQDPEYDPPACSWENSLRQLAVCTSLPTTGAVMICCLASV
jgi:hypothetical protein